MKLSTFYRKVAKHMQVNNTSQFICINIGTVYDNLVSSTKNSNLQAEYLKLTEAAHAEITLLLHGYGCITTLLPNIYSTRLDNFDFKLARNTRKAAYRQFILKFLASRAKLAGN